MIAAANTSSLALVGLALLSVFALLTVVNRARSGQTLSGGPLARVFAASGPRPIRLSAEHALHVVEVDGRRWLVGTGPAGAPALLAELESPALEDKGMAGPSEASPAGV